MAELDPRDGRSGIEPMIGEDEGDVDVLLLEADEDAASFVLTFIFGCFELFDEEKMALNMIAIGRLVIVRCQVEARVAGEVVSRIDEQARAPLVKDRRRSRGPRVGCTPNRCGGRMARGSSCRSLIRNTH